MANLTLNIGGRSYPVTCADGEQAHVLSLATMIDEQVRNASAGAAGMTEVRGLLFAALFLADALKDSQAELQSKTETAQSAGDAAPATTTGPALPGGALKALESLAERVEILTQTLKNPAS